MSTHTSNSLPTNIADILSQYMTDGQIVGLPQDQLAKILQLSTTKSKTTLRKSKKSRDSNKPKRPLTAYFLWLNEKRSTIGEQFPDLKGTEKNHAILKEAGVQWKLVADEQKTPYIESFKKDQQRYRTEMESYIPPPDSYDEQHYPPAHENWSGPFRAKYLYKVSKGEDGKNTKSFKSFDEAVIEANKLGAKCGGITKTSRGYSLRIGPDLITTTQTKMSGGLASWIKGQPENFTTFSSQSSTMETTVESTSTTIESTPKKSRGRPKGSKNKSKTHTPEQHHEPPSKHISSDNDAHNQHDEIDDDEMEVAEVTHEGNTYYHDETSHIIYHPETSEEVGNMVDGKIVLN